MAGVLSSVVLSGEVLEDIQQLSQREKVLDTAENNRETVGGKGAGEGERGVAERCSGPVPDVKEWYADA